MLISKPTPQQQKVHLRRNLGCWDAIAIVFSRIIGSGIYRTSGVIMLLVAGLALEDVSQPQTEGVKIHSALFYAAWIIAGLVVFLSALCFSEMVCMYPLSGGSYVFLKKAYSELWAVLFGWTMFLVSETASIVTVAFVSAEYASIAIDYLFDFSLNFASQLVLVLAIIWGFTLMNTRGLEISGKTQRFIGAVKIISLISLIYFMFTSDARSSQFIVQNFWPEEIDGNTFLALGLAMQFAFFTYSGWEGAAYVAEEIKNPQRNLPISLLLGIGGVIALYLLVNTGYLMMLGPEIMVLEQKNVATKSLERALGTIGGLILALLVMFSTGGNVATQIMVKARLTYALARDKNFFSFINHLHPKFLTPNRALYLQAGWGSFLLAIIVFFSENVFENIISFFAFTSAIFNITIMSAVFILRIRQPNQPRPFRVRFLPLVLLPVLLTQFWLMIAVFTAKPALSLLGISFIFVGYLYYQFIGKKNR